jgi:dolichol-phosphate mannosyltransferase
LLSQVFTREIIQKIDIREDRFGFEPEIVAKVAQMRLRIYEMGISYYGRTYEEGKKIGIKDGFSAMYCIFRYNAHKAPLPIQFLIYTAIGGIAAVANYLIFMTLFIWPGMSLIGSSATAFIAAAALNYYLCILILFRHKARWDTGKEVLIYLVVITPRG